MFFLINSFLNKNFFLTKIFFKRKFFLNKIFFQINFFPIKFFFQFYFARDKIWVRKKFFFEKKFYWKKIFFEKKKSQIFSWTEFLSRTEFCLGLHTVVVFCMQSFNFICHFGRHILKTVHFKFLYRWCMHPILDLPLWLVKFTLQFDPPPTLNSHPA